jgi:DNA-binding transcriptional regulator GbsR (MarR family)
MTTSQNNKTDYTVEPNLSNLILAMQKTNGYRATSSDLAKLLNTSQKHVIQELKKLEVRGIVQQIKTKPKRASIWEVKPIYQQALLLTQPTTQSTQQPTIPAPFTNLQKDYVTRKEFYNIIDSLHTAIHELNSQMILANQSLELIKMYWQRVFSNDRDKPGTAFTSS